MLIAEIHKKLADFDDADFGEGVPSEFFPSRKEDLLTADVFGAIKYLPREPFLRQVLEGIEERNPVSRLADVLSQMRFDEDSFTFKFWPRYRTPGEFGGGTTEPDVELLGPGVRFFFEAKLHSGFGDDQVARQLLIGLRRIGVCEETKEFFLVLVTSGMNPPRLRWKNRRLEIQDYLHEIAAEEPVAAARQLIESNSHRVLWVNWPTLASCLHLAQRKFTPSPHSRCFSDMLSDLDKLLTMRSLAPFAGIGRNIPLVPTDRPVFGRYIREFRGFAARNAAMQQSDAIVSGQSCFPWLKRYPRPPLDWNSLLANRMELQPTRLLFISGAKDK